MDHFKLLLILATTVSAARADLIAHYRFDEPAGNTASDSISNNHGTWVPGINATPNWQPASGILGGAIEFPGTGNHQNYFATGPFPTLNGIPGGMAIAAWVKPTPNSGYRGLLMTRTVTDDAPGSGTAQNFGLAQEDNHLDGRISGSAVDSPDDTISATGDWYHVAWVWDNTAGAQTLYIDGARSGDTRTSTNHPPGIRIFANGEWRIGDDACCNNRNFSGLVDDLAVWDEPLSSAAIAQLYQNGLEGYGVGEQPPTPLLNVGLVINEIHYAPDPKTQPGEFVELLNTGPDTIDLSNYTLTGAVSYTIPNNTTLEPGQYLVIREDPAAPHAYSGSLSNSGEKLTLRDSTGTTIDTVDYNSEFPWPIPADGHSIQLTNATLDNDLGASWRPAAPTPDTHNSTFAENAPPQLRQVDHSPGQPSASEPATISVKATAPDTVATVTLSYQLVTPGNYVPAYLPLDLNTLKARPETPLTPNPAYEENWLTLPMAADGDRYTATVPAQPHRTLVRYRITATDALGNSVRAPFPDDPSLNFAYFSYDGVPGYGATPAETLTSLPTYHLITRPDDLQHCYAYSRAGNSAWQLSKGSDERKAYNWEGAFVHDGIVYDHVKYRLRQNNNRYAAHGKRSMRFRFLDGNGFQARDAGGKKWPVKWRTLNTGKMSTFNSATTYGMREVLNSRIWRAAGIECPYFYHIHFRVIDGAEEAPDQHSGDFFGLGMAFEDIDGRLLDSRGLPDGNIYKLKDAESNPFELRQNQSRTAVTDASDFLNIRNNLLRPQTDAWLEQHVDWQQWATYHAVVEALRHYDYGTTSSHRKNRAWYFAPSPDSTLGKLRLIPHDHDATWSRGYHDGLDVGIGTGYPWSAIFGTILRPAPDGAVENPTFTRLYRNTIRDFRDLFWQEETVHAMIDHLAAEIAPFLDADRARWLGGPAQAGTENNMPDLSSITDSMKRFAFIDDRVDGATLPGGRAAYLDLISDDPAIPNTPTITSTDNKTFTSSATTPHAQQWRIAQVDPANAIYEWTPTYNSNATTPSITIPPTATRPGLTYRARVRQQNAAGHWSQWSDPVQFVAQPNDLTPYLEALVISEIMIDPEGGSDFEYVELQNTGPTPLDLDGVRFTKGIDFDFSGTLAPGAYTLAVRNLAAFTGRHGPDLPVAGEYTGKLDNAGERLKLSFGSGEPIRDFDFSLAPPWPRSPALTLIAPHTIPDHASPLSWRPSTGTPGTTDATTFPGGDLLAYATRGRPTTSLLPQGNIQLTVDLALLADDVTGTLQQSDDLENWLPADAHLTSTTTPSPDVLRRTFTTTAPPPNTPTLLRYQVLR